MRSLIGDISRSVALPAFKRAAGVVTRRLPIPRPTMMVGPGASARLGEALAGMGHRRVLVVTDALIAKLGLGRPLLEAMRAGGVAYEVFAEVTADAPIPVIERGIARYNWAGCDALVAIGGGSVIDAAKVIGLAALNRRHPRELVGYFKGWRGAPPLYAVPTTAGTGSEVTVAAVISDPEHLRKLVIADTRLVPRIAALDPLLMTGLPASITAETGMDALTHAVEAYLGGWSTEFSDRMALSATALIFQHLPTAVARGDDLAAREQMSLAATYAGLAFTRANVGNVHAIAHQLGGHCHVPHGRANAILLPRVLRLYGAESAPRLAHLAVRAAVAKEGEPEALAARHFIEAIERLNHRIGIPASISELRRDDLPGLAVDACWEADTEYPVPRRMSVRECEAILRELLPDAGLTGHAAGASRRGRAAGAKAARPRRRHAE